MIDYYSTTPAPRFKKGESVAWVEELPGGELVAFKVTLLNINKAGTTWRVKMHSGCIAWVPETKLRHDKPQAQ